MFCEPSMRIPVTREPLEGIEPLTSSLPRKCSTTELQRLFWVIEVSGSYKSIHSVTDLVDLFDFFDSPVSGRRGSNPRPTAWKAVALPTELLPQINLQFAISNLQSKELWFANCLLPGFVGKDGFEPPNSEEGRFTVCCRWPLGYLPKERKFQIIKSQIPTNYQTLAFGILAFAIFPEPLVGIEPTTYWLQISCSTSWAKVAIFSFYSLPTLTCSTNDLRDCKRRDALPAELKWQWLLWFSPTLSFQPTTFPTANVGMLYQLS